MKLDVLKYSIPKTTNIMGVKEMELCFHVNLQVLHNNTDNVHNNQNKGILYVWD